MVEQRGPRDGLGGEELGQTGSQPSNSWLVGSLTAEAGANFGTGSLTVNAAGVMAGKGAWNTPDISGTTAIRTPNAYATNYHFPGPGSNQGIIETLACDTIISGGMWVVASGATPLAKAAAASTAMPYGMALATTASGGQVDVLTRGYCYFTAEATVAAGDAIGMGAGAALKEVFPAVTGSNARGTCVLGAGSESASMVYLF